jgi:predicted short-subunit dehydrogenase-like oxidoreductase (DUF2520 family)
MADIENLRIGIIGAGKVGQTLGFALSWSHFGNELLVYIRDPYLDREWSENHPVMFTRKLTNMPEFCDLLILSVNDDAIQQVVEQLAQVPDINWHERFIVHTSGATSLDVLDSLKAKGARVGCLHPALPFAGNPNEHPERAVERLKGATFVIEASSPMLHAMLQELVQTIGGVSITIPEGKKAQYHAALCIASNYAVTLYSVAQRLLLDLGADQAPVKNMLDTLVQTTAKNLAEQGLPTALTGPLARGDIKTIHNHIEALSQFDEKNAENSADNQSVLQLYRLLAYQTYALLSHDEATMRALEDVLARDSVS